MKTENRKPFNQWSREEKRRATLVYNNKRIKVLEYLAIIDGKLKQKYSVVNKETKEPIKHYEVMLKMYMQSGMPEVEKYLQLYVDATAEQTIEAQKFLEEQGNLTQAKINDKIEEIKEEDRDRRHTGPADTDDNKSETEGE